ncbi:serine/threonine protein phosphatase 1 [Roseovarius litoreus]|uniref:Serine/threonine protein phosphatase 1 n=1 Tax=Roseovarius litoreus TaxID=1155722 RepID=A0A1M7K7L5_9RHOB|nr:metallophosphoesterase [Roseovarius litoreus]SHM61246.1 serine/threonine protein phosphatase 1 [Roseovarius litoreus]
MTGLSSLLHRLGLGRPGFDAPLAPDRAFVAVGDIHGMHDLLDALIAKLATEAPDLPLVFVGDYVDRGPDSAGVLRRLMELDPDATGGGCLLGNHEAMMLEFLDTPDSAGRLWMANGGAETLRSFGIADPEDHPFETLRDRLRAAAGDALLDWLAQRPLIWQSGNVVVSHAGGDPNLPIEPRRGHGLLWGHPHLFDTPRKDGLWMVHGHFILDAPVMKAGRIGIDTGAFQTGRLTAAIIEPGYVRFIHS